MGFLSNFFNGTTSKTCTACGRPASAYQDCGSEDRCDHCLGGQTTQVERDMYTHRVLEESGRIKFNIKYQEITNPKVRELIRKLEAIGN